MGGCCCCSSRGVEIRSAPPYYYYPQSSSDEHVPLSYHNVAASALSTGLLVNTNLEVSVPDAYRPPPAPMPFDAVVEPPRTPSAAHGLHSSKSNEAVQTTNINSSQEAVVKTQETSIKSENTKELNCKAQSNTEMESEKVLEVDLSKPVEPIVSTKEEEEDFCPTCLEEYDAENPKIIANCEHHFHLACILEWMERSDTCPVCDKEMIFDLPTD